MLINAIPVKRDIPHEPGEWVEIRRLSWKDLKAARKAKAGEDRQDMKDLGAEFLKVILASDGSQKSEEEIDRAKQRLEARSWDADQFDREILLKKGLAACSYAADGKPIEVALVIEQLDEHTAEWIGREIIALSRPPSVAEVKNDTGSSIAS